MYVKRLDVQGFKTFAKKTSLTFLPPSGNRFPVTAIVGPNGSGKSNMADAMRWVLGEQSLKLLRGKKSEDIIFSGSEGKAQAGFAEVSITLDNSDSAMPIEFKEVTITRRLFRDGTSDYLLNESRTRLADIQLLLAQANVGQRSYSVIAQGMIDHILVSSPEERKAFFDDATGVKQFQIKRHESVLKLKRTYENLHEVETVLAEIEPRLRSLKRQANRLEKREEVETELHRLETWYYGTLWWSLQDQVDGIKRQLLEHNKTLAEKQKELKELEKKTEVVEASEPKDEGLASFQMEYRKLQRERDNNRHQQFTTEKEIELTKVRAQSNWAPLPLMKIIEEIKEVIIGLRGLRELIDLDKIHEASVHILKRSEDLSKRLERPNPEDIKPDKKLVDALEDFRKQEATITKDLERLEKEIDGYAKKEQQVRTDLIENQRELRAKQSTMHELENKKNELDIQQARLDERELGLKREMDEFLKDRASLLRKQRGEMINDTETLYPDVQRLRYQLELIGGIDPEIIEEYKQTQTRFEFLDTQINDLHAAIKSTEKVVTELDEKIDKQSKKVFADINKKFDHYFKMLFGGGSASLVKMTLDVVLSEREGPQDETLGDPSSRTPQDDTGADTNTDAGDKLARQLEKHRDPVVGVDIQATPPGKRLKALNLLSGGERALTSIALLSAIMSVNPSPFVVLDEVDAALDEANTIRYAAIIEELASKSQFIIITHNRATMEKADVLYGVTMVSQGVSSLLSVHLEDITKNGTARR